MVEFVNVLKDHMKRYKEDVAMCDAAFNLYLSLVKIPKHESDSGELVPFSAGNWNNFILGKWKML